MHAPLQQQALSEAAYVSTGSLPPSEFVTDLVAEAHKRFQSNTDGRNSDIYPALARVPSQLFGVCVVANSGNIYAIGDTDYEFSIMSVSKPFVFALICELFGPDAARAKLGANATGFPFNSLAGVERSPDGRTNPMVNAGTIATTSLVPWSTAAHKWNFIQDGLSRFAGRELALNEESLLLRVGHQLQKPGHRWITPERQSDLFGPSPSDQPLCQAVLTQRQREGPGRHGGDLSRRRRQSDHQGAGCQSVRLSLRASSDDDCRLV